LNKHARLTPEKLGQLGKDVRVTATGDGTLAVHLAGRTTKWVEVGPLTFRRTDGDEYLAFKEDANRRVAQMFLGSMPCAAYERLAWYETSAIHLALLCFCGFSLLSAIALGPVVYVVRHVQRRPFRTDRRSARVARRLAVLVSVLHLVFLVLRVTSLQASQGSSPVRHALFVLPLLAALLTIGLIAFTILAWKEGYWGVLGRVHYSLVTLGVLAWLPFLYYWKLLEVTP
jgi:hypothetical protein